MHRAQHAMLGPDRGGEGLATGSRCAVLRAVGGTCPSEEVLPQGKDGSLRSIVRMREGGDRLREPNAARRLECPARCGSATQCALDLADLSQIHLKPSVRTSANGHGRPQAGRGPHSRSELPTPHLAHLAQAHSCQQLLKKNKNSAFFGRFGRLRWLSWRTTPGVAGGSARARRRTLIAQ
jgi:hypothetical protein